MSTVTLHYVDNGSLELVDSTESTPETAGEAIQKYVADILEFMGEDPQRLIATVQLDDIPVVTVVEISRKSDHCRRLSVNYYGSVSYCVDCEYIFDDVNGKYLRTAIEKS